jgi:uncharacterized protein YhfF
LPTDAPRHARYTEATSFGFTPEDANEIAKLVIAGTKTATGSVLWALEADGKPLPKAGDYWIALDGQGEPFAVLHTDTVEVIPFDQVPEEYALWGGEGDLTIDYWRRIYWQYIVRECERILREPSPKAPLVMERFSVAYGEPLRATS